MGVVAEPQGREIEIPAEQSSHSSCGLRGFAAFAAFAATKAYCTARCVARSGRGLATSNVIHSRRGCCRIPGSHHPDENLFHPKESTTMHDPFQSYAAMSTPY